MTDTPTERAAESTWTRLRRRKVVQWGLIAGAWGFLQGLEYVSDAFQWPPQIRQIALLGLLIGLPVVLVLAWYHGDRGQQRVSTPFMALLPRLRPALASIRNEPEFKAVFADIERDMAQQRARLAALPKDAPLELTDASR